MTLTSWLLSRGEKILIGVFSRVFFPPCSASVIVFNEKGELLVVRKGDYLMLPGGSLERNEGFEECAVREAREETGLEIEVIEKLDEWKKGFAGVEMTFLGEVQGGELSGSWEGKPEFLPREKVSEENWRWDRDVEELLEKADAKQ
ncbi:MAG: NUDIX hydrolase [Candidatus Nanosalina sp.]